MRIGGRRQRREAQLSGFFFQRRGRQGNTGGCAGQRNRDFGRETTSAARETSLWRLLGWLQRETAMSRGLDVHTRRRAVFVVKKKWKDLRLARSHTGGDAKRDAMRRSHDSIRGMSSAIAMSTRKVVIQKENDLPAIAMSTRKVGDMQSRRRQLLILSCDKGLLKRAKE